MNGSQKGIYWAVDHGAQPEQGKCKETTIPYPGTTVEPKIQFVSRQAVRVEFDKAWLADEGDVDRYLTASQVYPIRIVNAINETNRCQSGLM